ncbi:phosphatase PAP2 family protein [Streptomyces sp. BE20]|uniref:phosphatase PAP2 family protein n=1 Tax=Streptomyces sp. BE20 TaxID=3002525 RepID=UPI002E78225D|nr:phosphatase PAP2 family protein [Streptomyces sp. BE20]MEE1828977.1 phosphatase PAP2 family protein [Streptomyces sp. BE20]
MTRMLRPAPPSPPASAGRLRPATGTRTGARPGALSRIRLLAWPLYLLALLWYVRAYGLPYSNDVVFLWLIGALLAAAVHSGHGPRGFLLVLRDWVPVMAVVWTYSLLRGYGAHTPWGPYLWPQQRADELIGLGETLTVRLQHGLYTPGSPHWYDYAAVAVYMSHFFLVFVVLAVLWRRRHDRFRHLLTCYLALTFAGFATYILYPAVPPWLASQEGHLPALTRVVSDVLTESGLPRAGSIFENGSRFANDVAAMPSLHSAYPAMLLFFFWPTAGRRLRMLLVAYPLAMTFTLVYGAEHFIVDVFVGWAYAAAVVYGVQWLRTRRRARSLAATRAAVPATAGAGSAAPARTSAGVAGAPAAGAPATTGRLDE